MSSIWGNQLKVSLFGESHGNGIGITIDGLPSGYEISEEKIKKQMKRRAPGQSNTSTPRKEKDEFEILSGLFEGKTTGTPLTCLIRNTNTQSKDYSETKDLARPGHADYTGHIKYKGHNDYRGGGHFSGRLTAPIVFAGAICQQILETINVYIGSHPLQVGTVTDASFKSLEVSKELLNDLSDKTPSVLSKEACNKMTDAILEAKNQQDSIGGIIETIIINPPAGLGSPFFNSVESRLASFMFSIPAVKGISFGEGFNFASMKGSDANDALYMDGQSVKTTTNNNGGILGGISNGMPIIFETVFKPTPSISQKQKTINMQTMEETEIKIEGRHDPVILFRAVPVVETASAIVILDLLLEGNDLI